MSAAATADCAGQTFYRYKTDIFFLRAHAEHERHERCGGANITFRTAVKDKTDRSFVKPGRALEQFAFFYFKSVTYLPKSRPVKGCHRRVLIGLA